MLVEVTEDGARWRVDVERGVVARYRDTAARVACEAATWGYTRRAQSAEFTATEDDCCAGETVARVQDRRAEGF